MIPLPDVTHGISHIPKRDSIPSEFFDFNNKWRKIASNAFFGNLPKNIKYIPKEGVDKGKAIFAIQLILESFRPEHNHKIAACAYLLSEWFEDVRTA